MSLITRTIQRLHNRAHHRGLHGRQHIAHQRRSALLMISTGLVRVALYTALTIAYLIRVGFAITLFASFSFVAFISMLALIETAWGQFAASLAQLTAGDAHADVEHVRVAQSFDFAEIQKDVAALADLKPGPEAHALARSIREQIESRAVRPTA